jgi:phosphoserine phosphatase
MAKLGRFIKVLKNPFFIGGNQIFQVKKLQKIHQKNDHYCVVCTASFVKF